jgi:dTDP-glucose 4,6-dehydratase
MWRAWTESLMKILLTGGCGFIGSAVVRRAVREEGHEIVNIDKMTYAASAEALEDAGDDPRHVLLRHDICDAAAIAAAFQTHQPDAVMHLAAETHVDRSIDGPAAFIHTNITGTFVMLQAARAYFATLEGAKRERFRFHHISTDEVFGALSDTAMPFTETTPYDPHSPYSASKAASDHLARAWMDTYGLPVIVSNTSNNYGKWQFPEKLIPLVLINAIEEKQLPVYGDGGNTRDWLLVDDHAEALLKVLSQGRPGQTYCISARQPRKNLEVVKTICALLDQKLPSRNGARERLITFVPDRPGHDWRYEIDPSASEAALSWTARHDFEQGLSATIDWYLAHRPWWERIRAGRYDGQRLGAAA